MKREELLQAVLRVENGKSVPSSVRVSRKRGEDSKVITFLSGANMFYYLLQQEGNRSSLPSQLVREGWRLYWVARLVPGITPCKRCHGNAQQATTWCWSCRGCGKELNTEYTDYIVAAPPGSRKFALFPKHLLGKVANTWMSPGMWPPEGSIS